MPDTLSHYFLDVIYIMLRLVIPCSLLRCSTYFGGNSREQRDTSAKMSCQERDSSVFFSLLLAGEGSADDCALARWLSFAARRGQPSPHRLSDRICIRGVR